MVIGFSLGLAQEWAARIGDTPELVPDGDSAIRVQNGREIGCRVVVRNSNGTELGRVTLSRRTSLSGARTVSRDQTKDAPQFARLHL